MNKLKIRTKSGYGVAEMGITAIQILTQLYLLEFYTQTIGLSASLAGIALSISVVWDAISDPLNGNHLRSNS
jgi:Na+/melibiose symporter-like transporter